MSLIDCCYGNALEIEPLWFSSPFRGSQSCSGVKARGEKKLIIVLCLSLSSLYRIKDEGRGFTEDSDQRNRPGTPQKRTRFKMSVKGRPTRTGLKAPPLCLSSSDDRETLMTPHLRMDAGSEPVGCSRIGPLTLGPTPVVQCVAESHETCLCCSKYLSFLVALPVLLGKM